MHEAAFSTPIYKILTALHFELLYNISRNENLGKNIQAAAYYQVRTIVNRKF